MTAAVAPYPDPAGDAGKIVLDLASVINYTPKQQLASNVVFRHRFTLSGGARGGGKSYWLRWLAVSLLIYWAGCGHRNVRVGIFCEDYPALEDRQISKARIEYERIPGLGRWNEQRHEFHLSERFGGGVIAFRNLDKGVNVSGSSKYLSAEFAAVLVDELTRNAIDKFDALRGSIRWPGIPDTKFIAATNPGSIGHAWVKDIWVSGTFSLAETAVLLRTRKKADFAYVKATAFDNPYLDQAYWDELNSMQGRMRRAFLYGDWDVFEGMAFDRWHSEIHVVPNRLLLPSHGWRFAAGLDWGYRKGWFGHAGIGPEGDIEFDWEFAPVVGERGAKGFMRLHGYEAAQTIAHRMRNFPKPEFIYYDDQMDQDSGVKRGQSIKTEFEKGLWKVYGGRGSAPIMIPATKGPGSRAIKYNLMQQAIAWGDAEAEDDPRASLKPEVSNISFDNLLPWLRPKLRFQRRCTYAIQTIPSLPVDPDKPEEDVDQKSPDDHGYDGTCNLLLENPTPEIEREPTFDPEKHPGFETREKKIVRRKKRYVDPDDQPRRYRGVSVSGFRHTKKRPVEE
jgi:hypothetical protein